MASGPYWEAASGPCSVIAENNRSLFAVFFYYNLFVAISIVVAILFDDDLVISIVVAVLLNDNRLFAVAIPLNVARPDCYTDPDLFCSSRHCAANTRYGSDYSATRVVIMRSYNC